MTNTNYFPSKITKVTQIHTVQVSSLVSLSEKGVGRRVNKGLNVRGQSELGDTRKSLGKITINREGRNEY